MTIDEVMDKARLLRGLASDAKLALYLGTSQSSVAGWRNRRQWPSDELMLKLATAADIDPQFALIHLNIWRTEQSEVSNIYLDMLRKIGAGFVIVLALTNYSPAVAGDGAPAVYYGKFRKGVFGRFLRAILGYEAPIGALSPRAASCR